MERRRAKLGAAKRDLLHRNKSRPRFYKIIHVKKSYINFKKQAINFSEITL